MAKRTEMVRDFVSENWLIRIGEECIMGGLTNEQELDHRFLRKNSRDQQALTAFLIHKFNNLDTLSVLNLTPVLFQSDQI